MIKHVTSFSLLAILTAQVQAAPQDYWPETVQYFIDDTVTKRDLRVAERVLGDTEYNVYDVTFASKKNQEFSDSIPKSVWEQGEEVTDKYIKTHIVPEINANKGAFAESTIGLSLLKIYGVQRLPAVVIDGKFTTYGLTVGQSIKEFQWHMHREAQ